MENIRRNKIDNDLSINQDKIKEEFNLHQEKTRLNLRKNKINDIISSKRKITQINESNEEINLKYYLNIEDIKNIHKEYIIDIPQFFFKVKYYY